MTDESRSSDSDKQTKGVTIGDVEGGIHDAAIAGRDVIQRITNLFLGSTEQQRAQRNRRAMLELVRNFWVKGVLEQSLHGAAMIELGLEERADAVEHPWDMVLQTPNQPNRPLPRGKTIVEVFDEMNRALLILGEPGSGKTTMLLELARDTIARAGEDPMQSIPVVFNLSSWAEKQQPIAEWLVDELNFKYNIPKKVARPWVENDDLLLLLDGLDEVKLEHREACVKALNDFRQEHGLTPLVVCSRIADYEALTTRLKLQGAILLQPLTPQQVDQYLEGAGTELLAVRATLKYDTTLQELAQTPLMLSVMTLAYQGMSTEDLGSLDTTEARRRHVLDAYVQRMFERRRTDQRYSPERTIRWLAWLAQKMFQHAQTVFLIERMQPSWLDTGKQQRLYAISLAWIFGLIGGLIFGLIGNLCSGLLGVGLIWGLFFGLIYGLSRREKEIETVEALGWSWRSVWRHRSLISGLQKRQIEATTIPNQRIRQSARNAIIAGLIGWLIYGVLDELWRGPIYLIYKPIPGLIYLIYVLIPGLIYGLAFGLACGLVYGGMAVIQHFALRFILCCSGYIPWNYARFLDHAAERIFLRKLGGGYIFVHRMLLDYFAALEPKQTQAKKVTDIILDLPLRWKAGILLLAGIVFATIVTCSAYVYRKVTAFNYYLQGIDYAHSADPEQSLRYYTRATELDPGNAQYWNGLCWHGSLWGYAGDVMDACEQAVELAADNGRAWYRDSRGLGRALTGDYAGAIEDFESFVEWSKKPDSNARNVAWREAWIAELKAGRNPFDEATLEQLRNE